MGALLIPIAVKEVHLDSYCWKPKTCSCHWILSLAVYLNLQDNKPVSRDKWVGKVNFVEIRSFWHIFRSFDRMWGFFILCLQVIIWLLSFAIYVYDFFLHSISSKINPFLKELIYLRLWLLLLGMELGIQVQSLMWMFSRRCLVCL